MKSRPRLLATWALLPPLTAAIAQEPTFKPEPITLPTEAEAAKISHASLMGDHQELKEGIQKRAVKTVQKHN
jgi:hypothetical protein